MCGHAHVAPPQAFHTCLKRCRLIRSHRRTSFSGANASTGLNLFREKFNMFVLEYPDSVLPDRLLKISCIA
ncbi:hypothetical protein HBI56_161980 [Parastagonospora nodorum]|nr:hypothetical protein HBI10_186730 [Parastagonospora nodorum]KAH4022530.1 hypothetical protein HBI09_170760 [Parastagonospora nodorum]KAH4052293.1 hypothetical protein HBH49_099330 [Parastagonospora nodorum]KAH4092864.1 hypothetical protein HBH48_073260 [Parastagonospora nodorum]KAH4113580.1 hypothetical protein HBH47_209140 [Parastagonospora nodorum]